MNPRGRRWRAARLVPATGATWASAFVIVHIPDLVTAVAVALWSVAILGAVLIAAAASSRRRPAGQLTARGNGARALLAALTVAMAVSGAGATHLLLVMPARSSAAQALGAGERSVETEVVVVGKVEPRRAGSRAFDAAIRLREGSEASESVWMDATVHLPPGLMSDRIDVGARLAVVGTARSPRPGDRAVLELWASEVEVVAEPGGLLAATSAMRQSLVASSRDLPGAGGELVPGLAVGDTSAVSIQTDAAMKASSLSHLTAVSGANCAIVVGLAFLAAARAGAPRWVRVTAGMVSLSGFVLLVTPEPSVVRAATMAGIAMIAVLLGRQGAGLAILCGAVIVLLLIDPWLSSSLGFALSVAATGALLLLARPLAGGMSKMMPQPLALALSVPLSAQLACGPLLVLIDPAVPIWGVAANLLAAPAAPVATIVGLAACLASPIPVLQNGLTALAWLPASWIAATAEVTSALPFARVPWVDGLIGAGLLTLLGTLISVAFIVRGESRAARRIRRGAAAVVLSVAIGTAASSIALFLHARATIPSDWSILACDVGQGDALLVRSGDAVGLIDTGPDPQRLSSCLDRAGIDRLDLLVLTHFDNDHAGGANAVIGRAGVVLHGPPADDEDERLLNGLSAAGADTITATAGLTGSFGDAVWTIYWPRLSNPFPPGNDSSVTMGFAGAGIPSMLFLGDLSATPQSLLRADLPGHVDVVKVAHHGSADQDPALYAALAPRVALFTVGGENTFGHPRDDALALVAGSVIGRTDLDGMLAVWGTGGQLALWREHPQVVEGRG